MDLFVNRTIAMKNAMKRFHRVFLFSALAFLPVVTSAQDLDARSPKQNDPITKQQKAAEKKKGKRVAKQEKADKDALKQSMKLQTKETRKRMKKNKRKADKWNKGR